MNPDTGKIHEVERDTDGVERVAELKKSFEGAKNQVMETLERAEVRVRDRTPDSEPPPWVDVPSDWPRFSVGDEIPWKGWFFRVEYVDLVLQRLVIKPLRPKNKIERREKKRRRRGTKRNRR